MGRIIEGYWDCPYCGEKRILGRFRDCPSCGKPRGENTVFQHDLPNEENIVENPEETSREADWYCEFCDSLNPASAKFCESCGSPRTEKTYFEMKEEHSKKEEAAQAIAAPPPQPGPKRRSRLPLLLFIAAAIALLFFLSRPAKANLTVKSMEWARSVTVEELRTLRESAWSVPSGGRVYDQKQEVQTYTQVLDHYETREREVAEDYIDHYEDVVVGYKDLGNGFFEEITESRPVYETRYYTETYQEPVYVTVPIFGTKYYYEIDRWVFERQEDTSGSSDQAPYWAELSLKENEREGDRSEKYTFTAVDSRDKTYTYTCSSQAEWEKYRVGDTFNATLSGNRITQIQ